MKEIVLKLLEKELKGKLGKEEIDRLIEIPPQQEMGDFAFPCFSLAKVEKKNPMMIASELTERLRKNLSARKGVPSVGDSSNLKTITGKISDVESKGAYVNFFINKKFLAESVLEEAVKKDFGTSKDGKGKKIVVEFLSPNTNKPLHLGHMRNMSIGDSVVHLLEFTGHDVIKVNLNNDRGVHICKSMIGYKMFGNGKTPESEKIKSDHFVGDYYVAFSKAAKENPALEEEAQEMLRKWEEGDKEVIALWKKMNKWAFDGFKETAKVFGIKFDKEYYESKIYKFGKEIVEEGLKKGIFKKKEDGAVVIDLTAEGLGEKVLLRSDGTSIYITQDMYLAKLKDEDFNIDGSFYVVANEQDYHFKVLFSILKKLGYKFTDKLHHLSYGMVELPEGRMKSREGTVVDADDLIEDTRKIAVENIKKREELSEKELRERSLKISLAAIRYTLLKIDLMKNIVFNPKESLEFEGNTGPYLLYSYARASSILRKVEKSKAKLEIFDLSKEEGALLTKIGDFPNIVKRAYSELAPNLIANYAFELCQMFNEFYHAHQVIGSKEEAFRLKLIEAFRNVLKKSLNLLGIEELEEM
jgi:arginyl-tRNA synthetase